MTVLIGLAVILGLAYANYGSVRRFFSRTQSPHPGLARLDGNLDTRLALDSVTEAREAELSRQLLDGSLDSAAYRQAMAELAQEGTVRRTGDTM